MESSLELEVKDKADTYISASYLDLHLEIDSEWWLRTELYDT
jgi:dTDP-glucose pyrophosphorylase